MVELIVVLALIGALLAYAMPSLLGAGTLGLDEQAKTTASGVADTAVRQYALRVATDPWDAGVYSQDAAAASTLTADQKVTAVRRVPLRPDVSSTTLTGANHDLDVVTGPTAPSRSPNEASVDTYLVNSGATTSADPYWVIGVAVYAPSSDQGSGGSCWFLQQALNGPATTSPETYALFTWKSSNADPSSNSPDGDQCTGHVAARLDPTAMRNDGSNSEVVLTFDDSASATSTPAQVLRGGSWGAPLTVTSVRTKAAADLP